MDQVALCGVLSRIRDLGLLLLFVSAVILNRKNNSNVG